MYETIDSIPRGEVPWNIVRVQYNGPISEPVPPKWKTELYEFYVRDVRSLIQMQLRCPAFRTEFTASPYRQFNCRGSRVFSNLMSADWSWKQCVSQFSIYSNFLLTQKTQNILAENPDNHGAMLVPVLGGSDKTTVFVVKRPEQPYLFSFLFTFSLIFHLSSNTIDRGIGHIHTAYTKDNKLVYIFHMTTTTTETPYRIRRPVRSTRSTS